MIYSCGQENRRELVLQQAGLIVGAGSVVTKSVPANAIVAGNPARVLRIIRPGNTSE